MDQKRSPAADTSGARGQRRETHQTNDTPVPPQAQEAGEVIEMVLAVADGDKPPLVPDGDYSLAYERHKLVRMFVKHIPKLIIWFKVVTPGPHYGTELPRYYNVRSITRDGRRGITFKVSWRGDFMREYALLFGLPPRADRISFEPWRKAIIRGRVRTVSMDQQQREMPEALRYSVICELIEVEAGF